MMDTQSKDLNLEAGARRDMMDVMGKKSKEIDLNSPYPNLEVHTESGMMDVRREKALAGVHCPQPSPDAPAGYRARAQGGRKRGLIFGCDMRENSKIKKGELVGCNSGPVLPVEIVLEILIRLPVKKISQCKCVSKVWRSLIECPSFAQFYRRRNPLCLVSSVRVRRGRRKIRRRIYCSTIEQPEPSVNIFNVSLFDKKKGKTFFGLGGVTQVVNGLFCYYTRNQLFLSNVFTGESRRLPLPDFPSDGYPRFAFGFDPVNGVYKLLCLTSFNLPEPGTVTFQCDILTLGRNNPSWRRLPNSTRPFTFDTDGICINGALYWIGSAKYDFSDYYVEWFDLTNEKFKKFDVETIEQDVIPRVYLAQFRGRLSLLACCRENLILHTLWGDDDKNFQWTRHEAVLPGEFWRDDSDTAVPVGNLPTGEILLMNPNIDDSVTPIYSYDDRNNNFERLVAGKLPKSLRLKNKKDVLSVVSCMEQNMEKLDALLGGGSGMK